MFRGVGVADIPHLVANMLKGLLYLVSLAFFIFGDGVTGGDAWEAEASQFVVIRYLFPPFYAVW